MLFSILSDLIIKYATGQISLEELEEWMEPRLQTLFSPPYTKATELAGRVMGGLTLVHDGILSEDEHKRDLLEYVRSLGSSIEWISQRSSIAVQSTHRVVDGPLWWMTRETAWRVEPLADIRT